MRPAPAAGSRGRNVYARAQIRNVRSLSAQDCLNYAQLWTEDDRRLLSRTRHHRGSEQTSIEARQASATCYAGSVVITKTDSRNSHDAQTSHHSHTYNSCGNASISCLHSDTVHQLRCNSCVAEAAMAGMMHQLRLGGGVQQLRGRQGLGLRTYLPWCL